MPRYISLPLQLVLVVMGILTALFFLMRVSGDPVAVLAGPNATPEVIAQIRASVGLDDPLYVQYSRFLGRTIQLDFGTSLRFGQPAFQMVLDRFPATLQLALLSITLSVAVAIPVGIFAAIRRGRPETRVILLLAALGQATPNFWLGIVLILLFAVVLGWLPAFGSGEPRHLVLPVITLSSFYLARLVRLVRSEMLEVLTQDYIRTAHSKGLGPRLVLWRHALKNTLIPIVTVIALDFSLLIGSSVIVETVFTYNGIGRQLVDSITGRDYPVVQATVFFIAIIVVVVNVSTDTLYRFIDPRIRREA